MKIAMKRPPTIETRSIDWVPDDERHGRLWHQGPLWFLGNFQYFSIPIGFIGPGLGLSLGWTALAAVLGVVIGTAVMALHASQGPVLGLPQMIQSRAQFGYRGVVVPLLATLFTYLAFNVADQILLGVGLDSSFGWNSVAVAVVTCVGAVALAIFGHDWLHRAFRVILVVALPVMVVLTVGVLTGGAGGQAPAASSGFTWVAFTAQLSAAAAYNIAYSPYVSDYSRYLPSTTSARAVISSVFLGASTSALWLILLGGWLATRLGAVDGLAGLQLAGNNVMGHLGDAAALLSALALFATMGMNAYGAMLTILTAIDAVRPFRPTQVHRVLAILAPAVVWFVVAMALGTDSVGIVFAVLTLMLYLLVPWTAVNLVDFFVVRRGHYAITDLFRVDGVYGVWARRGLLAYAAGLLVMIPFMVVPPIGGWQFTGSAASALGGVDVSWIVGLAVSAATYLVLSRDLDVSAERSAQRRSAAELGTTAP